MHRHIDRKWIGGDAAGLEITEKISFFRSLLFSLSLFDFLYATHESEGSFNHQKSNDRMQFFLHVHCNLHEKTGVGEIFCWLNQRAFKALLWPASPHANGPTHMTVKELDTQCYKYVHSDKYGIFRSFGQSGLEAYIITCWDVLMKITFHCKRSSA